MRLWRKPPICNVGIFPKSLYLYKQHHKESHTFNQSFFSGFILEGEKRKLGHCTIVVLANVTTVITLLFQNWIKVLAVEEKKRLCRRVGMPSKWQMGKCNYFPTHPFLYWECFKKSKKKITPKANMYCISSR